MYQPFQPPYNSRPQSNFAVRCAFDLILNLFLFVSERTKHTIIIIITLPTSVYFDPVHLEMRWGEGGGDASDDELKAVDEIGAVLPTMPA